MSGYAGDKRVQIYFLAAADAPVSTPLAQKINLYPGLCAQKINLYPP